MTWIGRRQLTLGGLTAAAAAMTGARALAVERIATPDPGELITRLVVTGVRKGGEHQPYRRRAIFKVGLSDVAAGEVIGVNAYGELTNRLRYNVMLGWRTLLVDASGRTLAHITRARTYNITPGMHHGVFADADSYVFDRAMPSCSVVVQVYAASAFAPANHSAFLRVEKGNGRLSVLRLSR